jgi:hypothetical protein
VCSSPTSDNPLSFLCSNQENKKCVKWKNLFNACSYAKTFVLMRSKMFAKLVHSKSSSIVVVQVVGMYLIVRCVWALRNLRCCTIVRIFPTARTIDLAIQQK